ncbi:MAG: helix-turn-helix domain-containing protein [Rickettsiales bacterium]|nr:helix-turn-helix domain-containing protein [Rickettsiales bacterium]
MTKQKNNTIKEGDYSLGKMLYTKRNDLGLCVDFIAKELNVKARDILSIERNDLTNISKNLYLPGIIAGYARIVGIDKKTIAKKAKDLNSLDSHKKTKSNLKMGNGNISHSPRREIYIFSLFASSIIVFILLCYYNYTIKTNASLVYDFIKNYKLK